MSEIVAVDIGGTHARFALTAIGAGGAVRLGEVCTLQTGAHESLQSAWGAFAARVGRPLPRAAAMAFAGPVEGAVLKLTNSTWELRPASVPGELGVDRLVLINDLGAVAHAVAQLEEQHFQHLCGPERALPREGVISIIGPGTGLGVAQLIRRAGHHLVVETEGGHMDFAPLDVVEDRILAHLRERHGRVSVERIVAGMGLLNIHQALAAIEGRPVESQDDKALWGAALRGDDPLAAAAFDRYCLSLGAVAGDVALAHGAQAVVVAGGLGLRIADRLPASGFPNRFIAKGRFERRMAELPVKLITHPQAGLFGAAAAYVARYGA